MESRAAPEDVHVSVTGGSSGVDCFAGSGGSSLAPGSSWTALKLQIQVDGLSDDLVKVTTKVSALTTEVSGLKAGLAELGVVVASLSAKVDGLSDKMADDRAVILQVIFPR